MVWEICYEWTIIPIDSDCLLDFLSSCMKFFRLSESDNQRKWKWPPGAKHWPRFPSRTKNLTFEGAGPEVVSVVLVSIGRHF